MPRCICSSSIKIEAGHVDNSKEQQISSGSGCCIDPNDLRNILKNHIEERVHYYVASSMKIVTSGMPAKRFSQQGCAPNFAGGYVTLCTCKHELRASRDVNYWMKGVWIAGFSGLDQDINRQKQYLFYLMRIGDAFLSHSDLWKHLGPIARKKNARFDKFGDLYEPRDARANNNNFDPVNYYPPCTSHVHNVCWQSDIQIISKSGRPSVLLLGDPSMTCIWNVPSIYLDVSTQKIGRLRYARVSTLENLLRMLR